MSKVHCVLAVALRLSAKSARRRPLNARPSSPAQHLPIATVSALAVAKSERTKFRLWNPIYVSLEMFSLKVS